MYLYYGYELWKRLKYCKYEYGDPMVVLSVDGVMGLYLHMIQVKPRVTYVVILLCLMMIDIYIMLIGDYA